jgi:hypothetical protein
MGKIILVFLLGLSGQSFAETFVCRSHNHKGPELQVKFPGAFDDLKKGELKNASMFVRYPPVFNKGAFLQGDYVTVNLTPDYMALREKGFTYISTEHSSFSKSWHLKITNLESGKKYLPNLFTASLILDDMSLWSWKMICRQI